MPENLLITLSDPLSPISEAYRTLRMNLQYASLDKPLRTLLVTSPGPGEGKSTTLANLAVTMAQVDRKVIIADCDLRRPYLHQLFGLRNDVGLTTMMVEDEALETPPLQETGVEGLQLLASGPLPPRPADLLGSQRMEKVVAKLLEKADMVLFDGPPIM
ncbi:MAG: CpsD/CapB family tyrosine-protein kinase, partial [Anaerolineae bacterium]|nr:CpsD/CapB family tyrosine-protein kinase [Anaerolineae bacterium]